MSKRENIAVNLVDTLEALPTIKLVKREPFNHADLSAAQYPALWVESSTETREDSSIGGEGTRLCSIDYVVTGFVAGSYIDTLRNELISLIEEAAALDRTRGGFAYDTQTVNIDTDQGALFPEGGVEITIRVNYYITRGES